MVSVSVPLERLIVDAEKEVDLLSLSSGEIEATVRDCYSFLPGPLEVSIENDVAHVKSLKKPAKTAADAPELFKRGIKFAEQGNMARAIELFGRVLERAPGHVEARRALGMALLEANQVEEGRQRIVEAVRLDPNEPWLYLLLANSFSKHDSQPEKSLRFYHLAYAINPNDPFVLTSYGGVLLELGRTARGRELLEKALEIEPNYPNAAYGLALVDFKAGKPEETDKQLFELFQRPQFPDIRSLPVYDGARELVLKANRQIAEDNYEAFMGAVETRRQGLVDLDGIPIEIEEDNSIATHAVAKMAWKHNVSKHRILYKNQIKSIVPHCNSPL